MEYEKPTISDYGDLAELTAAVDHGADKDANFDTGINPRSTQLSATFSPVLATAGPGFAVVWRDLRKNLAPSPVG